MLYTLHYSFLRDAVVSFYSFSFSFFFFFFFNLSLTFLLVILGTVRIAD